MKVIAFFLVTFCKFNASFGALHNGYLSDAGLDAGTRLDTWHDPNRDYRLQDDRLRGYRLARLAQKRTLESWTEKCTGIR